MQLTDEDIKMLDGSIQIMRQMYTKLRELSVDEAKIGFTRLPEAVKKLYVRKDGKDTRFFDVVAEEALSLGHDYIGHDSLFKKIYNQAGVIITEERGKVGCDKIEHNTPVIISDPVDRSAYLERIINESKDCKNMGEVFDAEREKIGEAHARVEACNSSVTLLKDNTIKYSIILNLFMGEVFVAYEPGVFYADNITQTIGIDGLTQEAQFKTDETLSMLCYTSEGKYENNRKGTHLRFFDLDRSIKSPGGPNRFTYLLREEGDEKASNIGVIAHNGEKIQESLPNIAVAFFSNAQLQAYKLFCDREYHEHRAGKGLTPNIQNSIYNQGMLINTGLKLVFLNNHKYPSEFRDTTVITPTENDAAITLMEGMVTRGFAIRII